MTAIDPVPEDEGNPVPARRRRNRWVLLALAVLFAAPLIAALLWRPTGFVNSGDLVQPARPLHDVELRTLDGKPFRMSELRSKWLLVHFAADDCREACRRTLYNMTQVRLAQGKNVGRVKSVLIAGAPEAAGEMQEQFAELLAVVASRSNLESLAAQFLLEGESPLTASGRIYLVDPLGNLAMSFSASVDPSDIRRDLARLLRVSQIG